MLLLTLYTLFGRDIENITMTHNHGNDDKQSSLLLNLLITIILLVCLCYNRHDLRQPVHLVLRVLQFRIPCVFVVQDHDSLVVSLQTRGLLVQLHLAAGHHRHRVALPRRELDRLGAGHRRCE